MRLRRRMIPRPEGQRGVVVGAEQHCVPLRHPAGDARKRVWHVRQLSMLQPEPAGATCLYRRDLLTSMTQTEIRDLSGPESCFVSLASSSSAFAGTHPSSAVGLQRQS